MTFGPRNPRRCVEERDGVDRCDSDKSPYRSTPHLRGWRPVNWEQSSDKATALSGRELLTL